MKTKQLLILATAFFFAVATQAQTTYYVAASGDDSDGSSWATAYKTIPQALAAASSGDEVWVKRGTYVIADENSQLTYVEGVDVYGGFAGTETALSGRSTDPSLTIIEHDPNLAAANIFRLLQGSSLNSPSLYDGFTFDGKGVGSGVLLYGHCNLSNSVVTNGYIIGGSGAGINIIGSTSLAPVTVQDTEVMNNTIKIEADTASYLGGGAGIRIASGNEAATIDGCTVANNTIDTNNGSSARLYGAGILVFDGVIKNTTVDANSFTGDAIGNTNTGLGIAIVPQPSANDVLIDKCRIINHENLNNVRAAGILIDPSYGGQAVGNYTISNSEISNNSAKEGAGIMSTSANDQSPGWDLNVINSIIANNSAVDGRGGGIYWFRGGVLNVTYSTIVNNFNGKYGGGGIGLQKGTGVKANIMNTVIWGNTSGRSWDPPNITVQESASSISYSAIEDLDVNETDFTNTTFNTELILNASNTDAAGPNFVGSIPAAGFDASLTIDPSIWKLDASSPLIEAGDYVASVTLDFEGQGRPTSGDFILPDIGAYQNTDYLGFLSSMAEANRELILYPSVTNRFINLDTSGEVRAVEIFNLNGKSLLKTEATEDVDVSAFKTGLYLLKATYNDNQSTVKRFIKQ
jgi:hypothetical protein